MRFSTAAVLFVAGMAAPVDGFHIKFMSNYLDSLTPKLKMPEQPASTSGEYSTSYLNELQGPTQTAGPTQVALAEPEVSMPTFPERQMQEPPYGARTSAEDALEAVNILTETYAENEMRTLEALREISTSMKFLAEVTARMDAPPASTDQPLAPETNVAPPQARAVPETVAPPPMTPPVRQEQSTSSEVSPLEQQPGDARSLVPPRPPTRGTSDPPKSEPATFSLSERTKDFKGQPADNYLDSLASEEESDGINPLAAGVTAAIATAGVIYSVFSSGNVNIPEPVGDVFKRFTTQTPSFTTPQLLDKATEVPEEGGVITEQFTPSGTVQPEAKPLPDLKPRPQMIPPPIIGTPQKMPEQVGQVVPPPVIPAPEMQAPQVIPEPPMKVPEQMVPPAMVPEPQMQVPEVVPVPELKAPEQLLPPPLVPEPEMKAPEQLLPPPLVPAPEMKAPEQMVPPPPLVPEMKAPELMVPPAPSVPEMFAPEQVVVPEMNTPEQMAPPPPLFPETSVPEQKVPPTPPVPEMFTPEQVVVPEMNAPEQMAPPTPLFPETSVPEQMVPPTPPVPEQMVVPEMNAPEQAVVPEMITPEQMVIPGMNVPEQMVVPKMTAPEQMVVPEMKAPEQIVVPEMNAPEQIVVPEMNAPEQMVPPTQLVPEMNAPEKMVPPPPLVPEMNAPEQMVLPPPLMPEMNAPEQMVPPTQLVPEMNTPEQMVPPPLITEPLNPPDVMVPPPIVPVPDMGTLQQIVPPVVTAEPEKPVQTVAPVKVKNPFSYDPNSSQGPAFWSNLDIEGNQCGGEKQSPIAIRRTPCNVGGKYEMQPGKCDINDLAYTLGAGGPKASFPKSCGTNSLKIPVLEGTYEAVQFHTHIGSEHVLGGQRFGSELHIVHKEQGGDRFAVVGLMINPDSTYDNPIFQRLLDGWTSVQQQVAASCGMGTDMSSRTFSPAQNFNVYDLIPRGSSFYHYDGSLTTPPCSEVVWWEVADKPISVSAAQFAKLVKMTTTYTDTNTCEIRTAASPVDGSTNRPVAQDLGGRKVSRICPVDDVADPGSASGTVLASNGAPTYYPPPSESTDYMGL